MQPNVAVFIIDDDHDDEDMTWTFQSKCLEKVEDTKLFNTLWHTDAIILPLKRTQR